jgi:hypothetical protein
MEDHLHNPEYTPRHINKLPGNIFVVNAWMGNDERNIQLFVLQSPN